VLEYDEMGRFTVMKRKKNEKEKNYRNKIK